MFSQKLWASKAKNRKKNGIPQNLFPLINYELPLKTKNKEKILKNQHRLLSICKIKYNQNSPLHQ